MFITYVHLLVVNIKVSKINEGTDVAHAARNVPDKTNVGATFPAYNSAFFGRSPPRGL